LDSRQNVGAKVEHEQEEQDKIQNMIRKEEEEDDAEN